VIEFFFSSVSFCITKKEFWHEKRPENIPHLMILNKREREANAKWFLGWQH
jgi:hypothetical protein